MLAWEVEVGGSRKKKREWEIKMCFKHSRWLLFPQFLSVCNSSGNNPYTVCSCSLFLYSAYFLLPVTVPCFTKSCVWRGRYYLNSRNFSPWHLLTVYKFVFGWQRGLKNFISIMVPFYSFCLFMLLNLRENFPVLLKIVLIGIMGILCWVELPTFYTLRY